MGEGGSEGGGDGRKGKEVCDGKGMGRGRFSESVEQLRVHREMVSRAVLRWRSPKLGESFSAWGEYMEIREQEKKAEEHEEAKRELTEQFGQAKEDLEGAAKREKDRHMETCRRAVSRMMQIQLARAWEGYADAVMQKRERRETCQRVVRRMLHTHLAAAFDW